MSENSSIFDRSFFGKIFSVTLASSDKSASKDRDLHLITTLLAFDIYSSTYDKVLHHITVDRIASVQTKNSAVLVSLKSEGKSATVIRIENQDFKLLLAALTPIPSNAEVHRPSRALETILPALQLKYSQQELFSALTSTSDSLFRLLETTQTSPNTVIDIFSCLYKARFPRGDTVAPLENLELLKREIELKIMMHWLRAIQRAVNLPDVTHEYIGRIVVNLANMIGIMADVVDIDAQQLLAASVFFYDERNGTGVIQEAEKLDPIIKGKWGETRKPSTIGDLADRFYDFVIIAIAARVLGVYPTAIEELRDACVDRVMAEDPDVIRITTEKMNAAGKGLINDMLRWMTERRYEPIFHYVFALWPLRDVK
jgi:hypothetical protein